MTALDRLTRANPVPDDERVLSAPGAMDDFVLTVMERSGIVKPINQAEEGSATATIAEPADVRYDKQGPQRGRRVAVAAAAAAIVAIAATIGVFGLLDEDRGVEIAVAGLEGNPEAAAAFEAVAAAYDAYNSGDAETWTTVRSQGDLNPQERLDDLVARNRAIMAADARYKVESCSYLGFGDWPNMMDSGDLVTGHFFSCQAVATNSFHDFTGITIVEDFDWVVTDGEIAAASSEVTPDLLPAFNKDFRSWLGSNHPDVDRDLRYTEDAFPLADSLPVALEYMVLFVEDSSSWPRPARP